MATVKDPICAMDVDPANSPGGTAVYAGKTSHFCRTGCRTTFEKDPGKYTS